MSLTVTRTRTRSNVIENWLDGLDAADRDDALGYLRRPDMYAHTEMAKAISAELGYRISDMAVRGWRQRNL